MWTVFHKELLELLRDRRTLMLMLVVPTIVLPILIGGFVGFASMKAAAESKRVLHYAIFHADQAPELAQRLMHLANTERVQMPNETAALAAIKAETLDFAVLVPAHFEGDLAQSKAATLHLQYNDAVTLDTVRKRMNQLLDAYQADLRQRFLAARGMDAASQSFIAKPIVLQVDSTANERERIGELVGSFLPYLLLIFSMQACLVSAADIGAGEKERGTLESLLLLPLSRGQIVFAKFAAVAVIGCLTSAFVVTSLAGWCYGSIKLGGLAQIGEVLGGVHLSDFALIGLLILPANAVIAALLLSLSFYARSYKEASTYGAQLMVLLLIPIVLSLLPNMRLDSGWAWVPITNISLAVKEIVKGTLTARDLGTVLLSTTLVAGLLLKLCTEWCKREAVLFRS